MAKDITAVRRPALRYHGGKWILAPWIISHFPKHRIYVEPFGGAGSVLLRKSRAFAEIYNDLDGEIVSFFRVMRDAEKSAELLRRLSLTPFAREEFDHAYDPEDCAIEAARKLLIRSFMGFGSDGCNDGSKTGFRANSNRSGTSPAHDWSNLSASHSLIVARLAGVVIENRPAIDCMLQHDGEETLHYVDPPYLPETRKRSKRKNYRHEMTPEEHCELLETIKSLKGSVIVSGYGSELYDEALMGWKVVFRSAFADGASPRTEKLWINKKAEIPGLFIHERNSHTTGAK